MSKAIITGGLLLRAHSQPLAPPTYADGDLASVVNAFVIDVTGGPADFPG